MKNKNKIIAIDLFCGVGGLTYGLRKAGIDVKMGIDNDPECEFPYSSNNHSRFLLKSIEAITRDDIADIFYDDSYKLLAGCAPCQTFSKYNQKANSSDGRWWLLLHFSRLIRELEPDMVTMENVPPLIKEDVFKNFLENLDNLDYKIYHKIVHCEDYGLPQKRPRLVLLASKLGLIKLLSPKQFKRNKRTVRSAIGKLRPICAGDFSKRDHLHQSADLSTLNLHRIRASRPGGTWRDWESNLVAVCHKKETGKSYASVYGRMSWDESSPTITTQFYGFGNGRFGHPEQDRAISLREGAILQGFPRKYKFVDYDEPISKKTIGRLIGNAVPVRLGTVIGTSIKNHVRYYAKQ